MDYDRTSPPTPVPSGPEPATSGSRWPRRLGALAGVAVLSAAAIGFGTAGAQTDGEDAPAGDPPVVVHSGVVGAGPLGSGDMTALDECLTGALPDEGFSMEELPIEELGDDGVKKFEPSPEEFEALEAEFDAALEECESLLSDEERAEMARWDDFEACMDEALGDETEAFEFDPGDAPDEAVFEELDARFEAAESECQAVLPEDLRAEMDAWKDFDACIDGQFDDLGPLVTIEGDDGLSIGKFGEDAGTITVTKAAGGSISIEASGSATVSDGPGAEEKLFFPGEAACEDLVPEEAEA